MKTIIAKHITTKNTNNVWAVYLEGENNLQYCKSAASALRYMFYLKAKTSAVISENCLQRLVQENALYKAMQQREQPAEAEPAAPVEEAKPQRKPRTRKAQAVTAA